MWSPTRLGGWIGCSDPLVVVKNPRELCAAPMVHHMDETKKDETKKDATVGWMSDVQRVLALILIGSFSIVTLFTTASSTLWPDATTPADMAQTLQQALVNMCLIGLGFFFGSSTGSVKKDDAMIASAIAAGPTGTGPGTLPSLIAHAEAAEVAAKPAAEAAAPPAAEAAAPAAAEAAAPPIVNTVVPPAIDAELDRRGVPDPDKLKDQP